MYLLSYVSPHFLGSVILLSLSAISYRAPRPSHLPHSRSCTYSDCSQHSPPFGLPLGLYAFGIDPVAIHSFVASYSLSISLLLSTLELSVSFLSRMYVSNLQKRERHVVPSKCIVLQHTSLCRTTYELVNESQTMRYL